MKSLLGISALSAATALPVSSADLSLDRLYSLPRIIGTAPVGAVWTRDSQRVAFLWNDAGYEFRDIFVVDASAPAPMRLTHLSESAPPAEGDPGVVALDWHPDGKRLLFGRAGAVFFLDEGAAPRKVAEGARARFSPDGTRFAFLRDGDLWVAAADPERAESDARAVVEDPRAEVFVTEYEWAPDGKSLAFLQADERRVPLRGIPDHLEPEVALVPVRRPFPGEEPRAERLGVAWADRDQPPLFYELGGEPFDPIFSFRWSHAESLLVDTSDLYVKKRRLLVAAIEGEVREIYREEDPENVTAEWQAQWAPDERGVYFLSDRDSDYHVYYVALSGGAPKRITEGELAVSEFTVTEDGIVFVANAPRPEERQIFRVGLEGGEPSRLSRESGTHAPVVSPDGSRAAVEFSSDSVPPELFLTSLRGEGGERRVTQSPLPEFYEQKWAQPEYVQFESHVDGVAIHGRLLVPPGLDRTRKHPAIIGSIYSNTVRNQWGGRNAHPLWGLEHYLLGRGYILFNIDIRGSWGHGKAFRRGIRLDYGGIDVEDIESGVRYLKGLDFVDDERIGIWGSSYGGLLTCMSLFKKPGLFRAGVAGAPATNVFHALTGEMRVMMAPQDETAAYERASPFTHAEGLRDPLLIIHGMRDRIVLYKDSVALVDRLMRLGKDVDFVTLPDAGHGWDLGDLYQTRFAYRKLVEFFDRYLRS